MCLPTIFLVALAIATFFNLLGHLKESKRMVFVSKPLLVPFIIGFYVSAAPAVDPLIVLALALRVDCPIYVEEEVLKSSKVSTAASDKVSNEELRKWLENLNDEDMGRYKM